MHLDLFGDIVQNHGLHRLFAILEERLLTLDNASGDLEKGFTSTFQALDQPACLLQMSFQAVVIRAVIRAPNEARVLRVHPNLGKRIRIELDAPRPLDLANDDVGDYVFRWIRLERVPRAG